MENLENVLEQINQIRFIKKGEEIAQIEETMQEIFPSLLERIICVVNDRNLVWADKNSKMEKYADLLREIGLGGVYYYQSEYRLDLKWIQGFIKGRKWRTK